MKNRVKKRHFYFCFICRAAGYQQMPHETKRLEASLQDFDPLQLGNEVWGNVVPVRLEFGAAEIT
jgi:hypothetical protein